jgi:Leucine-rich repeat (LRR) protein
VLRVLVSVLLTATSLSAADPVDETIAAVKKLGGHAVVDDRLDPEAPVSVTFPTGTDALLVSLSKLPSVGGITFDDSGKCTETGFAALRELPDLQKLVLGKCTVTDKAAAVIATVRTLQLLYLGESKITDEGLAGFKKLKHLKVLDLYRTKVTDKGLTHLTGLVKLEELNLSGTKVSDAGVESLKELKALKLVRLNNTNVTREGVTRLEAALPKATVRW